MASEMLPMCKSEGEVPDVCYQLKPGYSVRAIEVIISFVNLKQHILCHYSVYANLVCIFCILQVFIFSPTISYSLIWFVFCRWYSFGRNPPNVWVAQFLAPTSSPDVLLLGTPNCYKCHQGYKKTSAPTIYFRHDSYPPCYSTVYIWLP
jgi:hypothetical protein